MSLATESMKSVKSEVISLGGGCFWCVEAVYEMVQGVLGVESGYCNGHVLQPSYEQVCSGETGHVEVVRVRFDPIQISLREVLEIFFHIHNPTTLNAQGNDVGTQYRSGIYFHDAAQELVAREVLAQAQSAQGGKLVTELMPETNYSSAEAYHQHYFAQHPGQGYCAFVVAPKVEKFRRTFAARLRQPGQLKAPSAV